MFYGGPHPELIQKRFLKLPMHYARAAEICEKAGCGKRFYTGGHTRYDYWPRAPPGTFSHQSRD